MIEQNKVLQTIIRIVLMDTSKILLSQVMSEQMKFQFLSAIF